MNNFEYSNPTRLVFGKGEESRIGELMRARVPTMSPVLVVYGGGSAKESGLLERISESLKAADLVPIGLGGVTPKLRRQKRFRLPLCSRFLLQAANRVSVL